MKIVYSNSYQFVNLLLTIVLPIISILSGDTTVFYIIYLYWWQELIATIIDGGFLLKSGTKVIVAPFMARFFVLFIHLIFIVVIFGLMSNWGNQHLIGINLKVFVFKDLFFNINLIGIFLNELWYRSKVSKVRELISNPFSGRMIVIHVSIIFGGFVLMFLNRRFPSVFTPENLWGSVLISIPFLLMKALMIRWED